MSYSIDHAEDGELARRFSQSLLRQVGFHCTLCSCLAANHANESCFLGTNAYIPSTDYKRHNTPFYTFNNDNTEFVIQVLAIGHGECLMSMFVKDDVIFRRFSIIAVAYLPM